MTKSPTIAELCHGRLAPLPKPADATREERIAILCTNLQIMREEMGRLPWFYPQSETEVPDWIDKSDRVIERCNAAIRAISNLPDEALLPSPFVD